MAQMHSSRFPADDRNPRQFTDIKTAGADQLRKGARYNPSQSSALSWRLPFSVLAAALLLFAACKHRDEALNTRLESRAEPVVTAEDYRRAERFLPASKSRYVLNDSISANWIGAEDRFWYKRQLPGGGKEFVTVDAASGEKQPSFDHVKIAAALSRLGEEKFTATELPFDSFDLRDEGGISFQAGEKFYRCDDDSCESADPPSPPFGPGHTPSPDGQWAVYWKDHNLWLKSTDGEADRALTVDGEEAWGYGTQVGTSTSYVTVERLMGGHAPQVRWSPDSRRILTQRVDERGVEPLSIIEHAPRDGSLRPRAYTMRYAFARDEVRPKGSFVVFDIPNGQRTDIDYPAIELTFQTLTGPRSLEVWWREDSGGFGFVHRKPYARGYSIHRVDLENGAVSTDFDRTTERTSSPSFSTPMPPEVQELGDGSLIYWSDESGWGHLYRTTPQGQTLQLTAGAWNVYSITRVDEGAGRVYFFGSQPEADGNPYFIFHYGVNFDGTGLENLTPEQATRGASMLTMLASGASVFSPSGKYFIDSWSETTRPGRTELRDVDGSRVTVLETADILALERGGFVPPEPFTVTAADGETTLYGTLFFPSDFDPEKSYPIIDSIYPGPQINRDFHDFSGSLFHNFMPQAVAELGFIVVTVDGRGTPGRSRDFHFPGEGNLLDKAGYLEDHVAAIEQLAGRNGYIDLERVGIYGWSGGGYASTHAILSFPDFFKVAVSGAGNHDPRTYLPVWGESYLGSESDEFYEGGSNAHLAENLQGKLFLIHGALDDNVHPANTYAVVDALIRANKDFDLLILPNASHRLGDDLPYFVRRHWDYFVTHLLGGEPPQGYAVGQGAEQ
jgi:dipeptidyl aminopeptidase/acylaminoacyl peptidase